MADLPDPALFTQLPAAADATLKAGATLSIPAGGTITVMPDQGAASPLLALPGTSDIAVFAGQQIQISPWATMAAGDVTVAGPARAARPPSASDGPASKRPGYWLSQNHPITVPGGAKISFLGRATLTLPAGTRIAAPGANPRKPARHSSLKATTTFPLPHSTQVIASQMWALLLASFLTLFGTGAELGILGVLTWSLAAAESLVRAVCVALIALSAVVVFFYSVISIRALADPAPGDALNATAGTSFML
ncbi:MAG TPA: hypothetical protein VIY52_08205 [Streptosporangiaceae bacterium]